MQTGQIDYPIRRMSQASRNGATFVLPLNVAVLLSGIAQRCVTVLPGQANLPWQIDLPTPPDAVAFLELLTSDSNGHKLKLPVPYKNLLVKILNRTALNLQGGRYDGTTNGN